jgi:sugar/nucleoside kinase (ribokinase family)
VKQVDVLCAGILVADVFASPIDRLPAAGELKTTAGFEISVGGCAANTAVDLRILGYDVAVAGKVGCDIFGDFVIRDLERRGIATKDVRRTPAHPTSGTVIFTVTGEDRRYLHCIGSNADFTLADVDLEALANTRVIYVGGYLAMPQFTPVQLAELFRAAQERGLLTVLDVVVPAGDSCELHQLAPVLPFTDYFLPNEDEAARLTGIQSASQQARRLAELNPKCTVIITQGARGSITLRQGRMIETPPFATDAVDESGAGDAFAAGVITGLLEGWDLDYTLTFASAVGASCTRALGCSEGVFKREEAVECIAKRQAAPSRVSAYPN